MSGINDNGFDAVFENLGASGADEIRCFERKMAHLSDLAELITAGESGYDFIFGDAFLDKYRACREQISLNRSREAAIAENRTDAARLADCDDIASRVYLCRKINDICRKNGIKLADFLVQDETGADISAPSADPQTIKIAYLASPYTERAYKRFSDALSKKTEPTAEFDFSEVCEAVYYGRADMCILPIENSAEGILAGFWSLIEKYDLKIVLACEINANESDTVTSYALLQKSSERLSVPARMRRRECLGVRVILDDDGVGQFFTSAQLYGMKLHKLISGEDTGRGYPLSAVFAAGGGDTAGFLLFLRLEYPRHEIFGLYTMIA